MHWKTHHLKVVQKSVIITKITQHQWVHVQYKKIVSDQWLLHIHGTSKLGAVELIFGDLQFHKWRHRVYNAWVSSQPQYRIQLWRSRAALHAWTSSHKLKFTISNKLPGRESIRRDKILSVNWCNTQKKELKIKKHKTTVQRWKLPTITSQGKH